MTLVATCLICGAMGFGAGLLLAAWHLGNLQRRLLDRALELLERLADRDSGEGLWR